MTYAVFIYNRSTKVKELAIDGLDKQPAEVFAAKMRNIYPQCPGQDWQGFDVTVESDEEETEYMKLRRVRNSLSAAIRAIEALGDSRTGKDLKNEELLQRMWHECRDKMRGM